MYSTKGRDIFSTDHTMKDSRGVGGGLANNGFRNHPTQAMVTSLVPLVRKFLIEERRGVGNVLSLSS